MTLDELQRQVNEHQELDLKPLFEAFRKQSGTADMAGFVRFLQSQDALSTASLAAIHGAHGTIGSRPRAPNDDGPTPGVELERYETIGLLGEGAMGAVHEARDVVLGRKVAVKTLLPDVRREKAFYNRFLAEMQITAQLDHPHIVPIYGLEVAGDGTVAYAMKLIAGQEFGELLDAARVEVEAGRPLAGNHTLEGRLEVFLKVCDAVAFAHEHGVVHRDLKPSNIMIGAHNEVYVMDWGIARVMGPGGASADAGLELYDREGEPLAKERTRVGQMLGTPAYMSPEQATALNDQLDGRSDLYTLGLILQEAVTLKAPVTGNTAVALITKAMQAKREPVRAIRGTIPREIEAIITKATHKEPAERYATVKELAADLRAFLRNEETSAAPDSGVQKIGRWISKHRIHSMAIMLTLLLAGAGTAIGLLIRTNSIRQAQHEAEMNRQEMQTRSALSAQTVDNELQRYEWALGRLVGTAQTVLSHAGTSEAPVYFTTDFAGTDKPSDLTPSAHYGGPVSVEFPAFSLSPGVDRSAVESELRSLEWLRPAWREAVLTSLGVSAHKMTLDAQRQLLTQAGVPIEAAFLSLSSGLAITYPGMARTVDGDPREDPDYLLAADKPGTHWRGPYPSDRGPMLSVSASVYDSEHRFRGVAGFHVSLGRVFEKVQLSDIGYVDETLMVGRDGKVITSSNPDRALAALPYPDVVAAIERGESGNVERDGKLITYTPLRNLESYFVAVTDLEGMAAKKDTPKVPVAAWASSATAPTPAIKPPPARPAPKPAPAPEPTDEDEAEDETPPPPNRPRPRPRPKPKDDDVIEEKNPFERWENHP